MKKGHLEKGLWVEGKPQYIGGKNVATWPKTSEYCNAWLCQHCGKVELGIYNKLPKVFAKVEKQQSVAQPEAYQTQPIQQNWNNVPHEITKEQVVERAPTVIKEKVQMQPIIVQSETPKIEIQDNPSRKINIVIVLSLALSLISTFLLILTWWVVVLWNVLTKNLLFLIEGS